jgi:serpin B
MGVLVCTTVSGRILPQVAAAEKPDVNTAVNDNNAFACALYSELAKNKGNLFFSPFSISAALSMTYAGARGETAKQMAEALHLTLGADKLHPALADLMKAMNGGGKKYQLSVANALWGQSGTKFQPEFLKLTQNYYGAGFKPVDFIDAQKREQTRGKINRWVESKTKHKIRDLIKPDVLTELTRLVLTNAIYFKGQWEQQFKPADTKNMPFYIRPGESKEVPLMFQTAKFPYTVNDQAQILELPYAGGDLSMVVVLPKPESSLAALEASFTLEKVQSLLEKLSPVEVKVYLPRFKMEQSFSLNETLKGLGMRDAFDSLKADFSGIATGARLYITSVIHKAFVEVNEAGTEAAASTAVVVGTKAIKIEPTFRADHPFLFLIRDRRTGSILFMGRMVEPKS